MTADEIRAAISTAHDAYITANATFAPSIKALVSVGLDSGIATGVKDGNLIQYHSGTTLNVVVTPL